MKINITGKNLEITSAIRSHIETKMNKLEKWQVDIISCNATFSEEPNKKKKFEAVMHVPKGQLVASATHQDFYSAVNEVEQKLERQLNKLRHKPDSRRASHAEIPQEPEIELEETA
jgi:ribosome-associated inhibitor A